MARGEGLRVRLSRIPGETPPGVLAAPLYLPAVIDGFGWTENFSHTEYDTVRGGQFSQPAMGPATARQLRGVDDVTALTMEWEPKWLVELGVDPEAVYDALFAAGRARAAVELLVAEKLGVGRPMLRMNITIRSINVQMRKGEPDTLYYLLRFTEWRNATAERKGAGGSEGPKTATLTATDTLHSLSMKFYKTATEWKAIATANGIKGVGQSTPLVQMARFKVGSKIKIPPVLGIKVGPSTTSQPSLGSGNIPGLN